MTEETQKPAVTDTWLHKTSGKENAPSPMNLRVNNAEKVQAEPVAVSKRISQVVENLASNPKDFLVSIGASAVTFIAVKLVLGLAFGMAGVAVPAIGLSMLAAGMITMNRAGKEQMQARDQRVAALKASGREPTAEELASAQNIDSKAVVRAAMKHGTISGIIGVLLGASFDIDAPSSEEVPLADAQKSANGATIPEWEKLFGQEPVPAGIAAPEELAPEKDIRTIIPEWDLLFRQESVPAGIAANGSALDQLTSSLNSGTAQGVSDSIQISDADTTLQTPAVEVIEPVTVDSTYQEINSNFDENGIDYQTEAPAGVIGQNVIEGAAVVDTAATEVLGYGVGVFDNKVYVFTNESDFPVLAENQNILEEQRRKAIEEINRTLAELDAKNGVGSIAVDEILERTTDTVSCSETPIDSLNTDSLPIYQQIIQEKLESDSLGTDTTITSSGINR